MLKNLVAEMARRQVTRRDIARTLGISYGTVIVKIKGSYDFTVSEAQKIRDAYFPDLTIEYLFAKEA